MNGRALARHCFFCFFLNLCFSVFACGLSCALFLCCNKAISCKGSIKNYSFPSPRDWVMFTFSAVCVWNWSRVSVLSPAQSPLQPLWYSGLLGITQQNSDPCRCEEIFLDCIHLCRWEDVTITSSLSLHLNVIFSSLSCDGAPSGRNLSDKKL